MVFPILHVISEAGGRMPTREVVAAIVREQFKPDQEAQGGKQRWERRIQFAHLRLIEDGRMKPDALRRSWETSQAGEKQVSRQVSPKRDRRPC